MRFVTGLTGTEAEAANVEVKCFDLAANPYLLLGSLLAAGQYGVREGLRLPVEVTGDPARFSAAELADMRLRRLPTSLEEATAELAATEFLRAELGATLTDAVLAVRRAEAEHFRGAAPDDVVAALRWIY